MAENPPTVCIIDDDVPTAKALSRLVSQWNYQTVTFNSASEFLRSKASAEVHCLLLDLNLPDINGLELQNMLADEAVPIVFLTGVGDVPASVRAMRGGAVDFLLKPPLERELMGAIKRAITLREEWLSDKQRLYDARERLQSLTPREQQVLKCVISGAMNKQIAGVLGIAEKTVKVHRGHITQKLRVRTLVDLIEFARNAGLEPDANLVNIQHSIK